MSTFAKFILILRIFHEFVWKIRLRLRYCIMLINILHNISSVILLRRLETTNIQSVKFSNRLYTILYSFQLKWNIEIIFIRKTLNTVQSKTFLFFLQPFEKLIVLFYPSQKKVISKDFLKLLFTIKVSKFYFCFKFDNWTIMIRYYYYNYFCFLNYLNISWWYLFKFRSHWLIIITHLYKIS